MELFEKLHIIHSWTGLFHTVTALIAIIFGTLVFFRPKGTHQHKRLGYIYVVSMLFLNLSAFGIYNFGGLSLFHGFALVSLFSIFRGIIPAFRRQNTAWITRHFYFMNWSVVGLYCAFWAEVGVRFFDMRYFWWVVMLATILTSAIGGFLIHKTSKKIILPTSI